MLLDLSSGPCLLTWNLELEPNMIKLFAFLSIHYLLFTDDYSSKERLKFQSLDLLDFKNNSKPIPHNPNS